MSLFVSDAIPPSSKRGLPQAEALTVLAPGTRLTGELELEGVLTIQGTVAGTVRSTGTVAVSPRGYVTGDIYALEIVVGGTVEGDLHARERAELQAGAEVHGNVYAPRVAVQEGGTLNGRLQIERKAAA